MEKDICQFEGCSREYRAHGWCVGHLEQLRNGRPLAVLRFQRPRNSPPWPCSFTGCKNKRERINGLCKSHSDQLKRGISLQPLKKTASRGSGHTNKAGYRVIGGCYEHHIIMEKILDRTLFADEEVHHLNGQRDDNRPENLELWSTKQPKGQRIKDKIEWAKEILARYGE